MLEVQDLTTSFPVKERRVPIVDGISFRLEKGKCLALVGESGCGKSMTALSILRLVPKPGRISGGHVLLDGEDLAELTVPQMRHVRGHEISMIFQEPMTSLNPVMRVGDQVVEALQLHEKVSDRAARARGIELFEKVGIPDPEQRFDTFPHQMSGGLKQRAMIAMALCTRPRVLLADEPTTALDVTIQAQILQLMRDLQNDFDTAILLITHDLGVVNQIADEVSVMYAGRIVETGSTQHILGTPSHPYTQGLLGALPGRSQPKQRLHEIAGTVPSPASWPSGCRFRTRCPEVVDMCSQAVPPLLPLARGGSVACYERRDDQITDSLQRDQQGPTKLVQGDES